MYEYISGKLVNVTPASAVIDCNGVGYLLEITLNTYSAIKDLKEVKLLVHEAIREDAHLLYGFFGEDEREMYRLLIGVNGVGPATARMILSTLTVQELQNAILAQNVKKVQAAKGVGPKAAQRIVLELHDKVGGVSDTTLAGLDTTNQIMDEAQAALLMLGFAKPAVEKALQHISQDKDYTGANVEDIIKKALSML
jgi:Holliday junction DNA helicase RuvA